MRNTRILYFKILLCALLLINFAACTESEGELEYQIINRTWIGDIGMNAANGERIYSEFHFGADGFGEEYQYYWSDNQLYQRYRFQWYWEDRYNYNLVLDYGREGISYMDDVDVHHGHLTGVFYLDNYSGGFPFSLEMW